MADTGIGLGTVQSDRMGQRRWHSPFLLYVFVSADDTIGDPFRLAAP